MHWTPEEIVELIRVLTPLIAGIGTALTAYTAYQINRTKARVKEASDKLDVVSDKADITTAQVAAVHACLGEARQETMGGLQEVKQQAEAVAQAVKEREVVNGGI